MSIMPDPMDALISFQQEFLNGMPVRACELDASYKMTFDKPNGVNRFSYAKIVGKEVQAIAIFASVEPIKGVTCFSVGYAVNQTHRGKGLAVEAVNKGIAELKNGLSRTQLKCFYVEAVIDEGNKHSINVAEKVFSDPAKKIKDYLTGTPSLYFHKLFNIRS